LAGGRTAAFQPLLSPTKSSAKLTEKTTNSTVNSGERRRTSKDTKPSNMLFLLSLPNSGERGRTVYWRKGWDSNPRCPCRHAGFQDRCLKPLGHPSVFGCQRLSRGVRPGKASNRGSRGTVRHGPSYERSERLSSPTQKPAGSNTAAPNWPLSGQGIRWRQCRGCA
jgi:hypothetical protein